MTQLIEDIKAINPEAAKYLETEFNAEGKPAKKLEEPDDIICLTLWLSSDYPVGFWRNIYLKLNSTEARQTDYRYLWE